MADDKIHENLLRRAAARQGLVLRRSRRRDPRALDYGAMWLEDKAGNVIAGDPERGPTKLDVVETWLRGKP